MGTKYNVWMYYIDQSVIHIGFTYTMILFVIFLHKHCALKERPEYQGRKKLFLHTTVVFVLNILCSITYSGIVNVALLSNDPDTQLSICHCEHIIASFFVGSYATSVYFFFIYRLNGLYSRFTLLALKAFTFTIIFTFAVMSMFSYEGSYIVHVDEINVRVCSGIEDEQGTSMRVVYLSCGVVFNALNLVLWYLFVKKLYETIKARSGSQIDLDHQQLKLLHVIKKQTWLMFLATLSTAILWGLQSAFLYGYAATNMDLYINISCVFLSVVYAKDYYRCLQCDRCNHFCCKFVEHMASETVESQHMQKHHKQIASDDLDVFEV